MRMRRSVLATIVSVVLSALTGPTAVKADIAVTFTGVTGGFADGVPRVIGWEFTTGSQPITVNQLGVFDFNQDGHLTSHDVAIYNYLTRAAVVTTTVPSETSAPLSSFFRYESVTPTVLPANTEFVIAASWAPSADQFEWYPAIPSPSAAAVNVTISPAVTPRCADRAPGQCRAGGGLAWR
jgi:hypothetical protein